MTVHSLAPGYAKIHYLTTISSQPIEHVIVLPVNLTTIDGGASRVTPKGDTDIQWDDAVLAYINVIRPLFGAVATAFDHADLFSKEDADSEPAFVATQSFPLAGTGVATTVVAGQMVMSFRTQDGNLAKITLLETIIAVNLRKAYSDLTAAQAAVADYALDDDLVLYARDNSYPQAFLTMTTKTNDILRKKRFNL